MKQKNDNARKIECVHRSLEDVNHLTPHPKNPNTHSEEQVALLAKIIRHHGWRHPIITSDRSGYIVAGHARWMAAKLLKLKKVPCDEQHFESERDEVTFLAADNRIAELSDIDQAKLSSLLKELRTEDPDLEIAGFDEDSVRNLLDEIESSPVVGDAPEQFMVIVNCPNATQQKRIFAKLTKQGFDCELDAR